MRCRSFFLFCNSAHYRFCAGKVINNVEEKNACGIKIQTIACPSAVSRDIPSSRAMFFSLNVLDGPTNMRCFHSPGCFLLWNILSPRGSNNPYPLSVEPQLQICLFGIESQADQGNSLKREWKSLCFSVFVSLNLHVMF